jgi:antitoxin (DNA-binding transcriptional repressor) of toxin-antitoxin stability system
MQTLGIKSLQTNPALLTRSLEAGEYSLITKRGEPIGIAVGFSSKIIDEGLHRFLSLKAYENGDLSIGELASSLKQTRAETLSTLGQLGIVTADYSLDDELSSLDRLGL